MLKAANLLATAALCAIVGGCTADKPGLLDGVIVSASTETLAPGVVHAAVPVGTGGMDIIDVDLTTSEYRPAILTDNVAVEGGHLVGNAYTPSDWLVRKSAIATINGGYFGKGPDDRKELVGLVVEDGKAKQHAPPIHGKGGSHVDAGLYVRSAFGVTATGEPQIVWASTPSKGGAGVYAYTTPIDPAGGYRWRVDSAVGCGPTLIRTGRKVVTDHEERLVNDIHTARTFVVYDEQGGKPAHFVMGIASQMTYADLADALVAYYGSVHKSEVHRAMCLDGGASTQLSYAKDGKVSSPRATMVTVPDAIGLIKAP